MKFDCIFICTDRYFDITVMAAESLYNLLMTDVATVCQSQPVSSTLEITVFTGISLMFCGFLFLV